MYNRIWAPWRIEYILGVKPEDRAKGETENECVLCQAHLAGDDLEKLILYRGELCFIMMNLYPYNSGHIMILPYRHAGSLDELTDEESIEMMILAKRMLPIFWEVMRPEGFNLGINLGRCAGAGIIEHVHTHIVPRWSGDANFMPVLGETKVISEHITETFMKLREAAQARLMPTEKKAD